MQYKEQNCLLQNTVVARMRRISIGHLVKPTYLQVFGFFRIRSNRNEKQQGEDSRHHGCVLAQDPGLAHNHGGASLRPAVSRCGCCECEKNRRPANRLVLLDDQLIYVAYVQLLYFVTNNSVLCIAHSYNIKCSINNRRCCFS